MPRLQVEAARRFEPGTEYPVQISFANWSTTPIELGTLFSSSLMFAYLSADGETNWFEGVQLLALYLIAGVCFFFLGGGP